MAGKHGEGKSIKSRHAAVAQLGRMKFSKNLQEFLFRNSVFACEKFRVICHLHFGTVIAFLPYRKRRGRQ